MNITIQNSPSPGAEMEAANYPNGTMFVGVGDGQNCLVVVFSGRFYRFSPAHAVASYAVWCGRWGTPILLTETSRLTITL